MYDFLEKNSLYIVLLIAVIIWIGLFIYLFRIDGKLKKLENQNKQIILCLNQLKCQSA